MAESISQGSNFLITQDEADALFELTGGNREVEYYDPSKLHLDTDTDIDEIGREVL